MSRLPDVNKILRNGRGMVLAYDQGFEHGPTDFDDISVNPGWIMDIAASGYFTAVAVQKGIAQRYYNGKVKKVPLILKVNGKSSFRKDPEPIAVANCTVEEAIKLGAAAVGYTIYFGSEYENDMIREFSRIEKEAHEKGLLVVVWAYPRGSAIASDTDRDTIAYSVRLAMELNADAIKTKWTGSVDSFRWVVQNAGKAKVFVSGGPKALNMEEYLERAKEMIEAGAAGTAIGRNIWQSQDPVASAKVLADIIYK